MSATVCAWIPSLVRSSDAATTGFAEIFGAWRPVMSLGEAMSTAYSVGLHPDRCNARLVPAAGVQPPYDRFLATADAVAAARPEVDLEIVREIFTEVATLLYDGLALDGLDVHDTEAVIAGLCIDLVDAEPGVAVRERARTILQTTGEVHDREAVSAAYLISAAMLQL